MRKPYFKWPQVFSIYESFRPAFHLLSFCLPITFPTARNTPSRTSLVQVLLFTCNISVILYIYARTTGGGLQFTQLNSDSKIMVTGIRMMTVFGVFYIIAITLVFRLLQKRFWSFIWRLDELDRKIHQFGQTFNYQREFQVVLIASVVFISVMCLLMIVMGLVYEEESLLMRILCSYFTFTIIASGLGLNALLTLFVFGIRGRFTFINLTVENIMQVREKRCQAVAKLARYHSELIDLTSDINQTIIGYVTMNTIVIVVFNLVNSLALFRLIMYSDSHGWILRLGHACLGLYQGLISIVLIAFCNSLKKQCKFTGIIIYKTLNSSNLIDQGLSDRLLMFSQQIQHRLATISCGFFIYDWSLLQTILSSIATYFVVIVQFDIEHQRRLYT